MRPYRSGRIAGIAWPGYIKFHNCGFVDHNRHSGKIDTGLESSGF